MNASRLAGNQKPLRVFSINADSAAVSEIQPEHLGGATAVEHFTVKRKTLFNVTRHAIEESKEPEPIVLNEYKETTTDAREEDEDNEEIGAASNRLKAIAKTNRIKIDA